MVTNEFVIKLLDNQIDGLKCLNKIIFCNKLIVYFCVQNIVLNKNCILNTNTYFEEKI